MRVQGQWEKQRSLIPDPWGMVIESRKWGRINQRGWKGTASESRSCCPGSGRSAREGIGYLLQYSWASIAAQLVKNLPAMWETWVWSLGWEDPLEKGKATLSNILAWRIPWAVKSMGSQRVGHDWATHPSTFQAFAGSAAKALWCDVLVLSAEITSLPNSISSTEASHSCCSIQSDTTVTSQYVLLRIPDMIHFCVSTGGSTQRNNLTVSVIRGKQDELFCTIVFKIPVCCWFAERKLKVALFSFMTWGIFLAVPGI